MTQHLCLTIDLCDLATVHGGVRLPPYDGAATPSPARSSSPSLKGCPPPRKELRPVMPAIGLDGEPIPVVGLYCDYRRTPPKPHPSLTP